MGSAVRSDGFELRPFSAIWHKGKVTVHPIQIRIKTTMAPGDIVLPSRLEKDQDIYDQVLDEVRIPVRRKWWQSGHKQPRRKAWSPSVHAEDAPLSPPPTPFDMDPAHAFDRVSEAYDLPLLSKTRLVVVGAGGAAAFLDDIVRTGVGQLVLIDPDTIGAPNIGTQQVYLDDLGEPKVEVLKERLLRINPDLIIETRQVLLDDLDDAAFRELACEKLQRKIPSQTLICGFTDSFPAQARINRLALQLGLPSICAQVYREGRGAEVTFTHPKVTPACHRCALGPRYRWYLEEGHENDVTSHQTPIFATTRLNALKGFITLALLHHRSDHPRWGGLLERMADRNLVQLRLDPDFASTMSIGIFDRTFERADRNRLFFDDVVWLAQEPECEETGFPPCPECGGEGDLSKVMSTIEDTRPMPGLKEKKDAAVHRR